MVTVAENRCQHCRGNIIHNDGDYICLQCSRPHITQNIIPIQTFGRTRKEAPSYKPREKGYKRGHYKKTESKVSDVVELYNCGYGIRGICTELSLAKNTVLRIIHEQPFINNKAAEAQRKRRQREKHQGILFALKGLVFSGKATNRPLEETLDRSLRILQRYVEKSPEETISSLMGYENFTVDDLMKKTHAIVLAQYLRLDPDWEEVEKDTFKLKVKHG